MESVRGDSWEAGDLQGAQDWDYEQERKDIEQRLGDDGGATNNVSQLNNSQKSKGMKYVTHWFCDIKKTYFNIFLVFHFSNN